MSFLLLALDSQVQGAAPPPTPLPAFSALRCASFPPRPATNPSEQKAVTQKEQQLTVRTVQLEK